MQKYWSWHSFDVPCIPWSCVVLMILHHHRVCAHVHVQRPIASHGTLFPRTCVSPHVASHSILAHECSQVTCIVNYCVLPFKKNAVWRVMEALLRKRWYSLQICRRSEVTLLVSLNKTKEELKPLISMFLLGTYAILSRIAGMSVVQVI